MRRIRYSVAMSLDGYIAGPGDEFDWIVMDPDIDFAGLSQQFDTYLLGRRTFEVTRSHGQADDTRCHEHSCFRGRYSRATTTMSQSSARTGDRWCSRSVRRKEKTSGYSVEDALFRSLAEEGFIDTVEVAIIPIVLGGGIPLIAEPSTRITLTLKEHTVYKKTGIVWLVYTVNDANQS